ncbi:hypothetical protein Bbelb_272240 [Branchiostoma belcheri]|nr:hypothetical protein Bbelb_272240 [Branchiostoma belcheri]
MAKLSAEFTKLNKMTKQRSPGYVWPHEHPGKTGPTGPVGHCPTRPPGKTGPRGLMGPSGPPGPSGTPHSVLLDHRNIEKKRGPYGQLAIFLPGLLDLLERQALKALSQAYIERFPAWCKERICLLYTNLAEVAAGQQQASDTGGAMPRQQPQTDLILVADAGANISNPMYFTGSGAMPGHQPQTDFSLLADKAANVPNPMYGTKAGATKQQEHPGETRPTGPVGHAPTGPSGPPGKTGTQCLTGPPRPNGPPKQPGHPGSTFRPTGPPEHYQTSGKSESNKTYNRCRGTCYKVFNTRKNFKHANTTCQKDGGSLAMPRDAETNDFLGSLVISYCTYWIGLHDRREEDSFEWVDGPAIGKYNSWRPGEPNRQYMGEDCVAVKAGKWQDDPCYMPKRFICQRLSQTMPRKVWDTHHVPGVQIRSGTREDFPEPYLTGHSSGFIRLPEEDTPYSNLCQRYSARVPTQKGRGPNFDNARHRAQNVEGRGPNFDNARHRSDTSIPTPNQSSLPTWIAASTADTAPATPIPPCRKPLATAPAKIVQRLIAARATLAKQRWSRVQDFCVGLADQSVRELAFSDAKL